MIKNENYIQISGWMINELKLSGNELMIYALIHGFCQDGKSVFKGSITYMQEWLNCSRHTIIDTLKSLVKKGLIIKNVVNQNKANSIVEYITVKSRKNLSSENFALANNSQSIQTNSEENALENTKKTEPSAKNTLPSANSAPVSSANFAPPSANSALASSANFAPNNTINNTINKNSATALKKLVDKIFGENAFDVQFEKKAADFFNKNKITDFEAYFKFIKSKVDEKNPSNPRGFAYSLFFQNDIVHEFQEKQQQLLLEIEKQRQIDEEKAKRKITCPVCSENFLPDYKNSCPQCNFLINDFKDLEKIKIQKRYLNLSLTKKEKYDSEYISFMNNMTIAQRLFYFNTPEGKRKKENFINELNKKYGLTG